MTTTSVLNPTLYRAMVRAFGAVQITHPGEPFRARPVTDPDSATPRLDIRQFGEAYRCCCPFCGDRQFQLSVNHRFGTLDKRLGRPLDFLATCFARQCLKIRENRHALFVRIDRGRDVLADARVGSAAQAPPVPDHLPASFTVLDQLRETHPARGRLLNLGHDPDRLARLFGVGYCDESAIEASARKSVVAPVTQDRELVGWLAVRFVEGEVRLLCAPGMRTGSVLYNIDQAKAYPTGVVVPTPDLVWRLGRAAVASLSAANPYRVARTLSTVFATKQLVLVSAPGTKPEEGLASRLSARLGRRFAALPLPRSATDASPKELRALVRAAAAERGLVVSFRSPEPDAEAS